MSAELAQSANAGDEPTPKETRKPSLAHRLRLWWYRFLGRRRSTPRALEHYFSKLDQYPELREQFFRSLPRIIAAKEFRSEILAAFGPRARKWIVGLEGNPEYRAELIDAMLKRPELLRALVTRWGEDAEARAGFEAALRGYLRDPDARDAFVADFADIAMETKIFEPIVRALADARGADFVRSVSDPEQVEVFDRKPDHHYVPRFYGRSAHKLTPLPDQPGFGALAQAAIDSGRTLLYYDRLHTIYESLVGASRGVSDEFTAVEVGVFRGGGLGFIAATLADLDVNATVFGFDTFQGHDAVDLPEDGQEGKHELGLFTDTSFTSVSEYVAQWPNVTLAEGRFEDTCGRLDSRPIHFVHLDVDIYAPTVHALAFFHERLVEGGIVVVDDYGFTTCPGAKQAVDEFVATHPEYTRFAPMTGQAVLIRSRPSDEGPPHEAGTT